jgi:hypothetical protein
MQHGTLGMAFEMEGAQVDVGVQATEVGLAKGLQHPAAREKSPTCALEKPTRLIS